MNETSAPSVGRNPLCFYPYAKTLGVAIELSLRPVDQAEPSDVRLDRPSVGR